MDDLIDELMDLYESYSEAKAELIDCERGTGQDYICAPYKQDCDELKEKIKATIKKIVEANNV